MGTSSPAAATTDRFDGRVVAVSGAASGMGAATAREFARRGATVVLIDVNGEGAEACPPSCRPRRW